MFYRNKGDYTIVNMAKQPYYSEYILSKMYISTHDVIKHTKNMASVNGCITCTQVVI